MTLRRRLLWFPVAALAGLAGLVAAFHGIHRRETASGLSPLRNEMNTVLGRLLVVISAPQRKFTREVARDSGVTAFLTHADPAWALAHLEQPAHRLKLKGLWVLTNDGSLVYAQGDSRTAPPPELPLPAAELLPLLRQAGPRSYYLRLPQGLYQLDYAPVAPTGPAGAPPLGWIVTIGRWDSATENSLSRTLGTRVNLVAPGGVPPASHSGAVIRLHRRLRDLSGATAGELYLDYPAAPVDQHLAFELAEIGVFVLFGVGLIVAGTLTFGRWIARPITLVDQSLETQSTAPLATLAAAPDEFGRLARSLGSLFADRDSLRRALEERARIGRDLHDGVIQNIYGAGIALANARLLLRTEPARTDELLGQIGRELNSSIHELRSYIEGIDPEIAQLPVFGQAVNAVVRQLQPPDGLVLQVEVDDALAATLHRDQRMHLLQIVRESASNALRHGQGNRLDIRWRREPAGLTLEIADDGRGFDPAAARRGEGLRNLGARARALGGILNIQSAPGQGTRIQVVFAGDPST